jgi:hypothetical protein
MQATIKVLLKVVKKSQEGWARGRPTILFFLRIEPALSKQ